MFVIRSITHRRHVPRTGQAVQRLCFCLFSPALCPARPGSGGEGHEPRESAEPSWRSSGPSARVRQVALPTFPSLAHVLPGTGFRFQWSCLLRISVMPQPPSLTEKCPCGEPHSSAGCPGCCRPKPRPSASPGGSRAAQGSRAGAGGQAAGGGRCCCLEPSWNGLALLSGRGCLTEALCVAVHVAGPPRGPGCPRDCPASAPGPAPQHGWLCREPESRRFQEEHGGRVGVVVLESRARCVSCELRVFTARQRPSFCLCRPLAHSQFLAC